MIRVRIFKYKRWAENAFKEWTREHEDEIQGLNRRNLALILRSGDELHFVCQSSFDNWSIGRKYQIEASYE